MSDPLHIAPDEIETLRVFAVDLPQDAAEALAKDMPGNGTPTALAELLGVEALNRAHVEIFPASDLKGIGLAAYISDGLGVAPEDVGADHEKLDAEAGYILVLHARAVGDAGATLAPKPVLRLLGTYRLAAAEPPRLVRPAPQGDAPAEVAVPPETGVPARLPRTLVLVGLLGAAILVLTIAYLIGASER